MKQRNTYYRHLSLLAALGSVSCPLVLAEEPAATQEETTQSIALPELEVTGRKIATHSTVGTKVNTPILETPQSVSAVTRADMDSRGVQRLTEAVSYTAGVIPEFQGIDSRADTLNIRGYDTGGFTNNIYLDGLRGPAGSQWNRTQFDTFGLESVEVMKGPSAVLYGQVSPGGLVNAISKKPTDTPFNRVGFQVSSHDTYQGTFDINGKTALDNVTFRLVGLARTGNSEIDYTDLNRYFIAPSLTWKITDRTTITFLSQFQKDEGGSTYQFLPQTGTLHEGSGGYIDPSTFLGEPEWNDYDRTQFNIGYLFNHEFNDVLSFRQNFRYTYLDSEYRAMVGRGTDATAAGNFARRAVRGTGETDAFAVDSLLEGKFSTGPVNHTLIGGLDFTQSDWQGLRLVNTNVSAINVYDPVYTSGIASTLKNSHAWTNGGDQDVTERQIGLYLQEQAEWGKWRGTLGLRHDWYDIDSETVSGTGADFDGNGGTTSTTSISQNPESTTWRAGLLYLFDNGLAPYTSYTTSFDSAPYTSLDINDQPLDKPTESEQFEIGLKYKPADNMLFTASVFELTEENRAVRVQPTPARYSQIGEARTRGAELESRIELFHGFDITAAYTYLDSEITKSDVSDAAAKGNRLPAVPKHLASLWLNYTFSQGPLDGLTLGSGVRYVGSTFGDSANLYHIPSYTLFDASIGYDLGKAFTSLKGTTVRLSATNLADKRYVASSTAAGAAWYGSGRNVSLGVNYEW
ncbi:MAG: TonB-dependent siderophore receptor [Luteolibacter sp.]